MNMIKVFVVYWHYQNRGMPVNSKGWMIKEIIKVVPTELSNVETVLNQNQQFIYEMQAQGDYIQWELVVRPDNEMLEQMAAR